MRANVLEKRRSTLDMKYGHLHDDAVRVLKNERYAYLEFGGLLFTTAYRDVVSVQISAMTGIEDWVQVASQSGNATGGVAND